MSEELHGRHSAKPAFVIAGKDIVSHDELVETDEASGTPPRVSAKTRTTVYVGALTFNALCLLVFGLLPIFDILDPGKAAQAMNVVITAINLVSMGLAVGYRPTRPGSPVKP
jgi:hypothetical protein